MQQPHPLSVSARAEYVDLYLIHFPIAFVHTANPRGAPIDPATGKVMFDKVPISETWRALEECVDAGLVKNLGVSNFAPQLLTDLLSYARCVSV